MIRSALQRNLVVFVLATLFLNPHPTQAIGNLKNIVPPPRPSYQADPTKDRDVLREVSVENVLDLPVVQQPADEPYYVSDRDGEITQFSMASKYGSIGLLAHNTRSGRYFSQLKQGQEVQLVYGDGRTEYYVVERVLRFQALQPESVSSSFRNLDRNETITAGDMFQRAYVGGQRLIFQTCIAAEGSTSWGRLFVVAMPKQ
jgi:hypothetical protein